MMADRWLYPASAFFALFLARLIFILLEKKRELVPVVTIAFVIFLTSFTIKRNHIFKNDLLLFTDTVMKFPESAVAHNNLGVEYKKRGYIKEAEREYRLSIKYAPDYNLPYNNLGVLYGLAKEHEKALESFQKAYERNSKYALTTYNMALTYKDLGKIEDSNKFYNISIGLNPTHYDSYYNLAANYYRAKRFKETLDVLKRAKNVPHSEEDEKELKQKIEMVSRFLKQQEEEAGR